MPYVCACLCRLLTLLLDINGIRKSDVTDSGTQYEGWKYIYSGYTHSRYPKPSFIWKFKGQNLRENNRISISEDGNLYIAQLSFNDAGRYSCEMRLGSLTQQRETIKLTVRCKMSISLL